MATSPHSPQLEPVNAGDAGGKPKGASGSRTFLLALLGFILFPVSLALAPLAASAGLHLRYLNILAPIGTYIALRVWATRGTKAPLIGYLIAAGLLLLALGICLVTTRVD